MKQASSLYRKARLLALSARQARTPCRTRRGVSRARPGNTPQPWEHRHPLSALRAQQESFQPSWEQRRRLHAHRHVPQAPTRPPDRCRVSCVRRESTWQRRAMTTRRTVLRAKRANTRRKLQVHSAVFARSVNLRQPPDRCRVSCVRRESTWQRRAMTTRRTVLRAKRANTRRKAQVRSAVFARSVNLRRLRDPPIVVCALLGRHRRLQHPAIPLAQCRLQRRRLA